MKVSEIILEYKNYEEVKLKQCKKDGAKAFSSGKPITINPYKKAEDPKFHAAWAQGYNQAKTNKKVTEAAKVWDTPNPKSKHSKLSAKQKAKAKARAAANGREYPNLIDNMWAAKKK